jgi:predicted metal-dependent phosphoesterase TrpH
MSRSSGRIDPADLAPTGPRRPPGGSLWEMHAHSSDRSLDSGVRAAVLIEQARWRGLDGVVLTDHNAAWHPNDLREMSERHEISVIGGMELGTDCGHVLVYGLDHYHPELLMLDRLRHVVEYEGAAMVLAHPMRPFHGRRPGWDEFPLWFEGVEVINADHSDSEDGYMARHARQLGLALVAGSDAHSKDAVGRVATAFPARAHDVGDIARMLRDAATSAVDFRPRATIE